MQQDRRRNPYPFTWEIPVAIVCGLLVAFAFGVHGGRAIANLIAGAGLVLPAATELFTSIPAVLRGDATAGLSSTPPSSASPHALRAWIITSEVIVLALATTLGALAWVRWGPGRMRGMATTGEATEMLGLARLRKHRAVIRPDLYRKATR